MSQPNPIIVEMSVQTNDVVVPMSVATLYAMPVDLQALEATENGEYDAPPGVAWDRVDVDVSAPIGTVEINRNGTFDVEQYATAEVAVPNSYTQADEGKVVSDGALVSQTSKNINSNGTHDTTTNNQVIVNVPNSYSQSDEGKVVQDGALVGQTARTVTENGTVDTTLNNSVTVDVPETEINSLSVTENGTYTAPSGKAYSPVSVNVGGGLLYEKVYTVQLSRTENTWTDDPTITIDCTYASSLNNMGNGGGGNPGYRKIKLKNTSGRAYTISFAFYNHSDSSKFETLELDGNLVCTGNSSQAFQDCRTIKSIVGGSLDLSAATNIGTFARGASNLETISFVPSSVMASITFFGASKLSDESLVSIANGLNGTVSGKSLTLHATPKARCQTLMGTVADGVFTADASGTVTLVDYITTVKGWTLA